MPATEAREARDADEAGVANRAPRIFLDTNVLIYALDRDPARGDRAEALLGQRPFISVQALNEVVNVLRRRQLLPWEAVADVVAQMALLCEVVDQTLDTHRQALALMSRHSLSWWDALMLAAALGTSADTFFSEDLQDGLLIQGRLRICNPFAA